MSIYDEAFNDLLKYFHENKPLENIDDTLVKIEHGLERAKKVEEELKEYKISDKSKEESSMEYYNLYKETKRKLKKVEELLGLYQKRFGFYNFDEDKDLREIKALEEEMK